MSQDPTEKEISTALEKLSITNDLEKNGENTEISSLFKPKILYAIDQIKRLSSQYCLLVMLKSSRKQQIEETNLGHF